MPIYNKLSLKIAYRLRERISNLGAARLRRLYWCSQGMRIGSGTSIPRMMVTWPHQVKIGRDCILEPDVYFKFDGIYKEGPSICIGDDTFIGRGCEFNISDKIHIGDHCLIASGVKFVDHNHRLDLGALIKTQTCIQSRITLEDDVWIGANAIILQGVSIGVGAVVGAGAVVRSSIAPYDIVGGVPARVLKSRRPKDEN